MSSGSLRRVVLPILVGLVATTVTACITWMLVRDDVARWTATGVAGGGELKFVFFFSSAAGILGFAVARRILQGAPLTRKEWTLIVPPMRPLATSYRESDVPSLQDLMARLQQRGYRLTAAAVDLEGNPQGSLDANTPLSGVSVRLTDERLGSSPAGLVLRLSERTGASGGLCTVEARDRRGSGYAELASFVIAEMDALTPGVVYKPSDSALTPDPAEQLRAVLPLAPRAIAGR